MGVGAYVSFHLFDTAMDCDPWDPQGLATFRAIIPSRAARADVDPRSSAPPYRGWWPRRLFNGRVPPLITPSQAARAAIQSMSFTPSFSRGHTRLFNGRVPDECPRTRWSKGKHKRRSRRSKGRHKKTIRRRNQRGKGRHKISKSKEQKKT